MIKKIKKLSLPVIIGLILAGVDLALWILFLTHWFLNRQDLFLSEGLLGMMFLHFPASFLLPLLGSIVVFVFNLFSPGSIDYLVPQTIFLFVVGITQYYFVGYFIGWLIVKLRRKLGFDKSVPEPQKKPVPSRKKDWIYNILHLLFTVLILQMLIDILSGMMLDFEMYKMNYPPTRHYLELALVVTWLYCTYCIVHYNKKKFDSNEAFKNTNKTLFFANILIVIIFFAVHIPKLSISDIPEATGLDSVYVRRQAEIFLDNPLERIIIMKTAIVGMDDKNYQVVAYTFFGLKYRLTDIEKVSEYEMRLLFNPSMQKRQHEAQADIDYVWDPDHNVKESDIGQILKSIAGEVSERKYFDENLKLSFTHPDNFYIEKDALGPNFDIVITPFGPDDLERDNPEGFVYTSLRMKKVTKGYEYDTLKDYFQKKSQDKELYPNYSQEDLNVNGKSAEEIKYVFPFSGGMDVNILLDVGDYILHISYYDDIAYVGEYKQIIDSIAFWPSITEELAVKFKSAVPGIDIKFQEESSLWWNDEDGYSILVPGIESIEISRDDGVGADNFTKSSFVRDLLEIADQVMEARGFSLDEKNTSVDETDRKFYDYVQAFKNGEELCVVRVNPDYSSHGCSDNMFMCNTVELTCANDLLWSQAEQRPFLEALDSQNKEMVVQIRKQIGDYFQLGVGGRRAGSEAVMKKEDSGLRLIYMSQEDPFCEVVKKENIPNNVLEGFGINGCWTETGYEKFDN